MASPDTTPYVDLTLFDLDPQDIFDAAKQILALRLSDWVPREANTEVLLMEALAQEVSELIFAANRLPDAVVETLLKLYGIDRDNGTPPTVNLTFYMSGTTGYTIPVGTQVRMDLAGGLEPLVFTTNVELTIAAGYNSGTVAATGDRYTAEGNGVPSGTQVELLDSLVNVDLVLTYDAVTGGAGPEDDTTYFDRAVQRFARLTDTLVLPSHFVSSALEETYVKRAYALDNYTPAALATPTGVTATPQTTGGTLAAGTYSYRVSAINANGETLTSAAVTATTTGTTGRVTVAWSAVSNVDAMPVTGYRIYGRTGGSELLMATVSAGTLTWDDTGSIAPAGARPTANTTVGAPGNAPGHMTVAVYGDSAVVSSTNETALEAKMEASALGNLNVHIMDPTITAVAVTVNVQRLAGYDTATVIANVTAALDSYLNPMTWNWGGTVRLYELVQVINEAAGVDYIVSLTTPSADVALTGVAPLADLGAVSVTVSG